ncbi:MAG TPA: ATP synthase subunit I [Gammaproteobacteria bacterium]|nr:ATP synthase subunit I [Gammaproteobacteria bacterium]
MKNQIFRTLVFQVVLGGGYLAGIGLWNPAEIPSALVGCVASLVPKAYFGLRLLRAADNNSDAAQWLGSAYRAELGKWVIMGAIFVLVFNSDYPWDPVVLFAGFSLIQLSGWVTPLVMKGN